MKGEQENIELIEQYLKKELTSEQNTDFEKQIQSDLEFKSLYEEIKLISENIKEVRRSQVVEILDKFESKNFGNELRSNKKLVFNYKLAAVISLLISSIFVFYIFTNKSTENTFIAAYFEPFPNQIIPTTRSIELPKEIKAKAYYQYDLGNYDKAVELLRQIPASEDDGASLLYLGISHLVLGSYDNSIKNIQDYLTVSRPFKEQGQWYLFLAYVANDNNDLALELMNDIDASSLYRSKVVEISSTKLNTPE